MKHSGEPADIKSRITGASSWLCDITGSLISERFFCSPSLWGLVSSSLKTWMFSIREVSFLDTANADGLFSLVNSRWQHWEFTVGICQLSYLVQWEDETWHLLTASFFITAAVNLVIGKRPKILPKNKILTGKQKQPERKYRQMLYEAAFCSKH